MPSYDYVCTVCGERFERFQAMSAPDPSCPSCGASVRRQIVAGASVITHADGGHTSGDCAYETTGTTCCGSQQRCASPGCGI